MNIAGMAGPVMLCFVFSEATIPADGIIMATHGIHALPLWTNAYYFEMEYWIRYVPHV